MHDKSNRKNVKISLSDKKLAQIFGFHKKTTIHVTKLCHFK